LERFKLELSRATGYLEYGSGGSTLLVDKAGIPGVSVESDPYYAIKVRKALLPESNVTLVTPKVGLTKQWGRPIFSAAGKGREYVNAPFAHLGHTFPDLCLVDGRYRVACALEVARRANGVGQIVTLIVDDYARRPIYQILEQYLGSPEKVGRSALFLVGHKFIDQNVIDRFISEVI
jgi:hypothetical protein